MGYNRRRKFMYNRETRRGSPSNFVYVGNEIEVDSSVVLKQSFCRQSSRMKYLQGKAVFEYENIARPLAQTPNGKISEVAFANNFAYYFTDEAPAFSRSDRSKATLNFSAGNIDPNSEDGCNIDLSEVTVDVAAIPQPSRNYIVSRRCRELVLRIFLPLLMLFALPMMNSCKDPDPQLEPTKTITFDWDWGTGLPSKDSLKYYTDQPDVKNVIMQLRDNAYETTGFQKHNFKRARDSLDTRFAIDREKIVGSGKIYLSREQNKDQIEDSDSLWFVMNGFVFTRKQNVKN